MTLSGLMWTLLGLGMLVLIVWGISPILNRVLLAINAIRTWWRGTPATPTQGATPATKWTAWIPLKTWTPRIWVVGVILAFAFFFQPSRDFLLDWLKGLDAPTAITGTETVRSVLVEKFDGFDICDLKPETSYTFVEAKTEKQNGDEVSYKIRHRTTNFEQLSRITGMFSSTPEKLPYKKGDYADGILVNGVPPGRRAETNEKGCLRGSFNSDDESARYFDIVPIRMSFSFR